MKPFNVLRGYIVRANITHMELSKLVGISHVALSKRFMGRVEFTRRDMLAIKNVLNRRLGGQLTIDELFFRDV